MSISRRVVQPRDRGAQATWRASGSELPGPDRVTPDRGPFRTEMSLGFGCRLKRLLTNPRGWTVGP